MQIKLVRDFTDTSHLCFDYLQEFEHAILSDPQVEPIVRSKRWIALISTFWKAWRMIGRLAGYKGPYVLPRTGEDFIRFSVLMGPSARRCADFIFAGKKAAFLLDATPPWTSAGNIARFIRELDISDLFVTHPEFVRSINKHETGCNIHFLPEAINPSKYFPLKVSEKDIDVYEFGRKMPGYHDALKAGFQNRNDAYYHDFIPDEGDFVKMLGRAKIITCFPRSMTHKDSEVEMLTARYFQGFVSKALIIGKAPKILDDLFGYNPIIEAKLDNPVEQILEVLSNYGSYEELIERNYQTVLNSHTFEHRWQKVRKILFATV